MHSADANRASAQHPPASPVPSAVPALAGCPPRRCRAGLASGSSPAACLCGSLCSAASPASAPSGEASAAGAAAGAAAAPAESPAAWLRLLAVCSPGLPTLGWPAPAPAASLPPPEPAAPLACCSREGPFSRRDWASLGFTTRFARRCARASLLLLLWPALRRLWPLLVHGRSRGSQAPSPCSHLEFQLGQKACMLSSATLLKRATTRSALSSQEGCPQLSQGIVQQAAQLTAPRWTSTLSSLGCQQQHL